MTDPTTLSTKVGKPCGAHAAVAAHRRKGSLALQRVHVVLLSRLHSQSDPEKYFADKYQLFILLVDHFQKMGDNVLNNRICGTNSITHTRSRNGKGGRTHCFYQVGVKPLLIGVVGGGK